MAKAHMGAKVKYCGHEAYFVADIFEVAGANVIRANGPINDYLVRNPNGRLEDLDQLNHPNHGLTHHVSDFPQPGFWRPDLGVLVVPADQVTKLRKTHYNKNRACRATTTKR